MKLNAIAYIIIILAFIAFIFTDPYRENTVLLIGCLFFLVRIADKLYEK